MTNVKAYTTEQLLTKIKSLKSFKFIPTDYYIVGVRSEEDAPNKFDDKFYIFKGEKFIAVLSGTTNPGTPVLKGGFLEYNKDGAAVVKSDEWYYDVWAFGKHMRRMDALVQVGKFLIFRDGDKDEKSEEQGILQNTANNGINFHSVSYDLIKDITLENIGGWSAGCQVCNQVKKYAEIIALFKGQRRVSYCLLKEF